MSDIRAVCFDLDDTLRDPSGARDALLRNCRRVGAITGIDPSVLLASNSTGSEHRAEGRSKPGGEAITVFTRANRDRAAWPAAHRPVAERH